MYNKSIAHQLSSCFSVFVDEMTTQEAVDLGEQFTEIFIKNHDNVALLVSLLEVRWKSLVVYLDLSLGPYFFVLFVCGRVCLITYMPE